MNGKKLVPLTGLLSVLLVVGAFVIIGETPSVDAKITEVVDFWADHDSEAIWSGLMLALAGIAFIFFAGAVRNLLREAGASEGLVATGSIGAGAYAIGLDIFGSINFALGDASGDVDPVVMQTLNVLGEDMFVPLVIGVSVFSLSTGIAAVKSGALPKPLAWIAVVIGIVAMLGPGGFFAFLALGLWTVVTSIMLTARADS